MNECRRPQLFIGRAQRAVGRLLRPTANDAPAPQVDAPTRMV
jgi:hypothetical protein